MSTEHEGHRRRLLLGVGWGCVAAARAVRCLDRRARTRDPTLNGVALDERQSGGARRARGPEREFGSGKGCRYCDIRSGSAVHRRSFRVGASASHYPVRRTHAVRPSSRNVSFGNFCLSCLTSLTCPISLVNVLAPPSSPRTMSSSPPRKV